MVALRKESVDRNIKPISCLGRFGSLSARRAWIEIKTPKEQASRRAVALRKESVDRNGSAHPGCEIVSVALRKESVDRNSEPMLNISLPKVALRKESVDRNPLIILYAIIGICRSPQGERG